jgi:general secretion pathway protein D
VAYSVNYLDVGLKLDVEPTIYADDEVAIKIALEVSSLGPSTKTASGTLAYQIGTRNATTLLRLRDGETQLLAGLISHDERSTASRVPGIGDLPVLGRLFSSQLDNGSRTELVLAITPRILRNVRRPDANETELWVGTESAPKLRPVGGLRALAAAAIGEFAKPVAPTGPDVPLPGLPLGPMSSAASPPGLASVPVVAPALKWTAPGQVRSGETFEVLLVLASSAALRGLPMEIAYAKDKLELLEAQEGDFFRQGGATTSYSKTTDGKGGTLSIGILRNQASGAIGDGAVVKLRFKAIASGTADVHIISAQPIGLGGAAPSPSVPPPLSVQIR